MPTISDQKNEAKDKILALLECHVETLTPEEVKVLADGLTRRLLQRMKLWELEDWREKLEEFLGEVES